MNRVAYVFLSFLLLLGSTVSGRAAVANDCAGAGPGDPCDDGIFCNGDDACGWRQIDGTQVWGCLLHIGDPCQGGLECANLCNEAANNCYRPQGTPCADDGNACTDDECDSAGACTHPPNVDPCDDGLYCNGNDRCQNGDCSIHAGDPCVGGPECANLCNEAANNCYLPWGTPCTDDGNVCTDDKCNGLGACVHLNNSDPCDDGLFCTATDICAQGNCVGVAVDPCVGGPECANVCNEEDDNCLAPQGTPCTDDANACTDDQCNGTGACAHPPNHDTCDDGLYCNGDDTCKGGACTAHAGDPCVGGPECANLCNEAANNCLAPQGTPCTDDANVCTDDQCNGTGACTHPNNNNFCDDGLFCTPTDICAQGKCYGIGVDPCAGGAECANVCNEEDDNCLAPQGTPCTDDANVCTDDQCNGTGACAHPPNDDTCDDGLYCYGDDTCNGGACSVHAGDPCVGGPECANLCNEAANNCHRPQGTPCTDDGNLCTDEECNGLGACVHPHNNKPCDDALFCSGDDQCNGGSCSFHTGDPCAGRPECALACDEQADTCAVPQGTPCSPDGNPCTDDVCLNEVCTHVTVAGCQVCAANGDCDDGNTCTTDVCGDRGCKHTALPGCGSCTADADCDDGNVCTDDTCTSEICEHAPIMGCKFCTDDADCDDSSPCTLDTCGINGCENTPVSDCVPCTVEGDCDDADACTVDRCGPESRCIYRDADCFMALTCPFADGLVSSGCTGERIPRAIAKLVNRAGCKLEKAETRARSGGPRVEKDLTVAERSLTKAMSKVTKVRGKKISSPCADELRDDLVDRSSRIAAMIDQANGGKQLAACTAALAAAAEAAPQDGPALCRKR